VDGFVDKDIYRMTTVCRPRPDSIRATLWIMYVFDLKDILVVLPAQMGAS